MNDQNKTVPPFIFWIIWMALMTGVFVMRLVIATPVNAAADVNDVWQVMLMPVVISTILRWAVLPRMVIPRVMRFWEK